MPTDAPGTAKKLQLTDTPNVAQVIRIVKQLQYEDRWHRRIRRWFARGRADVEATVVSIDQAASSRKRIDASGRVVVEGPAAPAAEPMFRPTRVLDETGAPAAIIASEPPGLTDAQLKLLRP